MPEDICTVRRRTSVNGGEIVVEMCRRKEVVMQEALKYCRKERVKIFGC